MMRSLLNLPLFTPDPVGSSGVAGSRTTSDVAGNPNPATSPAAVGRTSTTAPAGVVAAPFPASVEGVADGATVSQLAGKMRPALVDLVRSAIGDLKGTTREGVAEFVDDLAPEIAKQTILQNASGDDPAVTQRATDHLRHLRGQVVMRAGMRIVGFEQRRETQLVAAVDAAVMLGRHWLLGGIA